MTGDVTTSQFVNSPVITVSFEIFDCDWYLLEQSETWKRIQNFLEVSRNKDNRMSLTERVNLLETVQSK